MRTRRGAPRITGRLLNELFQLGAKDQKYECGGKWFHHLKLFPGVLCDLNGYIRFNTRKQYLEHPALQHKKDLHVVTGRSLSDLTGYRPFPFKIPAKIRGGRPGRDPVSILKASYREGDLTEIRREIARRDPRLRTAAIATYGVECMACGESFAEKYGEIGDGFIELHHLKPISTYQRKRKTSVHEVRVVCSNCHRMLHRRKGKPLTVAVLARIIAKNKWKARP